MWSVGPVARPPVRPVTFHALVDTYRAVTPRCKALQAITSDGLLAGVICSRAVYNFFFITCDKGLRTHRVSDISVWRQTLPGDTSDG